MLCRKLGPIVQLDTTPTQWYSQKQDGHINRPFYRCGGVMELIIFKKYYGMLREHEHYAIYSLRIYARFSGQFFFAFFDSRKNLRTARSREKVLAQYFAQNCGQCIFKWTTLQGLLQNSWFTMNNFIRYYINTVLSRMISAPSGPWLVSFLA